jgi:hypothetical protein
VGTRLHRTVRPLHPPRWRRRDRGRAGRGRPEGSQRRADRLGLPHPPADTGAYNCRQITGGTNYSLHAYGIAVDLNWSTNPYGRTLVTDMPIGMIEAIEGIRTAGGVQVWRWGGRYSNNKDAMHFEVVASPAELARGIQSQTTTNTERLIVTPEDERKIQAMLDTQGNRIIEFLGRHA